MANLDYKKIEIKMKKNYVDDEEENKFVEKMIIDMKANIFDLLGTVPYYNQLSEFAIS